MAEDDDRQQPLDANEQDMGPTCSIARRAIDDVL
jgi:hypothetical protein